MLPTARLLSAGTGSAPSQRPVFCSTAYPIGRQWRSASCPGPRQRIRRPRRQLTAAAGDSSSGGPESAEAAFATAQRVMDLFMSRSGDADLDSVVEYLPEAVIDRLLERRAAKRREGDTVGDAVPARAEAGSGGEPGTSLSFEELVALAQPSDLALDSYSTRGVLSAPPRTATVLSSLKLAQDRFLQRYEVVTQSGKRDSRSLQPQPRSHPAMVVPALIPIAFASSPPPSSCCGPVGEEMVLTFDMQLEEALIPKYRGLQVPAGFQLRCLLVDFSGRGSGVVTW